MPKIDIDSTTFDLDAVEHHLDSTSGINIGTANCCYIYWIQLRKQVNDNLTITGNLAVNGETTCTFHHQTLQSVIEL